MRAIKILALTGAFMMAATAPALAEQRPRASLKVAVTVADTAKTVRLTCDRDGGNHPTPRAACRLLRAVKGKPARLEVRKNPICTKEFRPHTVEVWGAWRGKPVRFTKTYSNACLMKAAGGAVFTL
ncbi:SSI family serine proteinase inhibitor [Nonomuraea roseola]|uniref:SSI family serine proteinase inhibitor n=1 Tax=Nonomuraea roseola TaxID=46179 RepID=A0ABV5PW70_9ACTN